MLNIKISLQESDNWGLINVLCLLDIDQTFCQDYKRMPSANVCSNAFCLIPLRQDLPQHPEQGCQQAKPRHPHLLFPLDQTQVPMLAEKELLPMEVHLLLLQVTCSN